MTSEKQESGRGWFTYEKQLVIGQLWPSYFLQSHSAHNPPALPPLSPLHQQRKLHKTSVLHFYMNKSDMKKWRIRPLISNGFSLLMKHFRSGHSVGFCQVTQTGSVLINNIGQSIQDYVNGPGSSARAWEKGNKRPGPYISYAEPCEGQCCRTTW